MVSTISLVVLLAIGLLVGSSTNASGTPVVFGPEHPAAGNDNNTDPVFSTVQNWRELVKAVEKQDAGWYKDCLAARTGVTWEQAQQYAALVDQGHDLRFILVSNSSVSDDQARQMLRDRGIPNVDNLPITRLNSFRNTRGLPQDKCQAFGDERSQVRVSLAIPNDVNDLSKGVHKDKGVLAMCSNPWDIPPPGETPPPAETNQPPTTTTQPPGTTIPTTEKPPLSRDCQQNGVGCPPGFTNPVRQPPQDNTTSGVNTGPTPGAPSSDPPPADRSSDSSNGSSGDGGAGPPAGPVDNTHSDDTTSSSDTPSCPLGPGNC